jgi:hypothetical protein
MKQIKLNNISKGLNRKKIKIIAIVVLIVAILMVLFVFVEKVNAWYNTHYFQFNPIVQMKFNHPIEIMKRVPIVQNIVLEYPSEVDTPIKKYICNEFGPYNCEVALAIVTAESNFNDQAIHVDSNETVDLGCWQINFPTHSSQISPEDALNCYRATDFAYKMFEQQGFRPWTTYTSGSYLIHIGN